MNLFLDKIVPLFAYPVGFSIVAAVFSAVMFAWGWRRWASTCLAVGVGYLWAAATPLIALYLVNSLELQYPVVKVELLPHADVVVVLGGMSSPAQRFNSYPDFDQGVDRIIHAARLMKAGRANHVLISGGNLVKQEGVAPESTSIATLLQELGIDSSLVILEGSSRNTRENALNSARFVRERRFTSVMLVTSAMHMPRAIATFRKAGVEPIPVSIDTMSSSLASRSIFAILPESGALDISTRAIKEWIGLLVYRVRGWA
jgi:uncharacterized SAM-binding protein YcdF (DUF218 family)